MHPSVTCACLAARAAWTHIWANYKAQRRPLPVTDEDGTDEDLKDLSHGAAAGIYFKETRAQVGVPTLRLASGSGGQSCGH